MKAIIDRIEGDFAIVESEDRTYDIPLALCPEAKEGDMLEITVTKKEEAEDRADTHAIFERLRGKKKNRKSRPRKA